MQLSTTLNDGRLVSTTQINRELRGKADFETMIFTAAGAAQGHGQKYDTEAQARAGHAATVSANNLRNPLRGSYE